MSELLKYSAALIKNDTEKCAEIEKEHLHLDNNDPYQAALIDMNKEAERLVPTIITNRPS